MVKVTEKTTYLGHIRKKISENMWFYIISLVASFLMVIVSLFPGGYEAAGTFLLSVGCSGIAASIMAIFLERISNKKDRERKAFLRYIIFGDINNQLRMLFERIMWFDRALPKLDLSKDIQYYMSLDFVAEACLLDIYECLTFSDAEKSIYEVMEKYKADKWDDEKINLELVNRMFQIIGEASKCLSNEIEKIENNRLEIIQDDIMNVRELDELIRCIEDFTQAISLGKGPALTAVKFLWGEYKKVRELCGYTDDFYVFWQPPHSIIRMHYDRKKKKLESSIKNSCRT